MMSGDPLFCIACAFVLLVLPINWLLSAAAAALVHEVCHILAVWILGGKIRKIHISVMGCRIDTGQMGNIKSILCILAGPTGSLSLLLLGRTFPRIAVCGFFQGCYNLLPIMPLDGGRVLQHILNLSCPNKTKIVMDWIRKVVGIGMLIAAALTAWLRQWDVYPTVFCLIFCIGLVFRKIPCKENRIGLQWY